jgi:hypothetical protein
MWLSSDRDCGKCKPLQPWQYPKHSYVIPSEGSRLGGALTSQMQNTSPKWERFFGPSRTGTSLRMTALSCLVVSVDAHHVKQIGK